MKKQRKPITFIGYDAKIKRDGLWVIIGRFKTIEEAREKKAQKLTPRYSRA